MDITCVTLRYVQRNVNVCSMNLHIHMLRVFLRLDNNEWFDGHGVTTVLSSSIKELDHLEELRHVDYDTLV